MGKKRKSIATSLDEVDRSMHASFCSAANSLSQLYTQAMNQQKLSFQAGERHGFEKLYQWIWRQEEGGSRVATVDILNYLRNELDCSVEEPSMSPSPRAQVRHQHPQSAMQFTNPGFPVPSGSSGQVTGQGTRSEHCHQQPKNSVFSNALSSPICRSPQHYQIAQGGGYPDGGMPPTTGGRNNDPNIFQQQNRDSNPPNSNDSSMDMHAD